jgi:hypothetical protein
VYGRVAAAQDVACLGTDSVISGKSSY